MSPSLPARIGRFAVVELIGTGAFATVFRARDDRLDADVALKVLAENHSFDPDIRERFIMEGHLLRRVDSPHVVSVFDLGETDAGQPYLVLDLATGGDLRARRRDWGDRPVPRADLALVADHVALALAALHAERVVHRDVTPGNLLIRRTRGGTAGPDRLLGPGERLVLADLGLSKDLALASGLTVGAGTAGFTPPEQRDAAWVDPRADIWSASALLVWLATGRQPDDRGWPDALRRSGQPDALVEVLARGLSSDVTARHPDAGSWRDEVAAALAAPSAPPAGPGPATPPAPAGPPPVARRSRARLALTAGVAGVALVGGGVAGRASAPDAASSGSTEQLADGQVRTSAADGDLLVAVVGPASVAVGDAATFVAEVDGATSFVWLAPDGQVYVDAASVTLRPEGAGASEVRLVGVDGSGRTVSVIAPLTVDP